MATLYQEGKQVGPGRRQWKKGLNSRVRSIPVQSPDDQGILNTPFHSCASWPSDPTGRALQSCLWGYWEKEMRSHVLMYAVSTQNILKQPAGVHSSLSPSST